MTFGDGSLCVLSGGLLGVAVDVELGKQEEQGKDVPGVHDHDAGRVARAPVERPTTRRANKAGFSIVDFGLRKKRVRSEFTKFMLAKQNITWFLLAQLTKGLQNNKEPRYNVSLLEMRCLVKPKYVRNRKMVERSHHLEPNTPPQKKKEK